MELSYPSILRQSEAGGMPKPGTLNVLVVDDQTSVLKLVRKMLYDLNCFRLIAEAEDGEAAWSKLKKNRQDQFDIVITDIYMPKLDGIGLITRCRKSTFARDMPFLVITGETRPEILAVLGEMGVRDCLVKPFSMQLLQQRIHSLFQKMIDPLEKSYNSIAHLAEEGDYQEALARLARLSDEEAEKPRWLNLKGEIFLGMGQFDTARDCVEKALTCCDYYLNALCIQAKLEEKAGNLEAAVEFLQKADALSPMLVDRKIALGDLLFRLDRQEDGRKILCKAASITRDIDTKLQITEMLSENGFDLDADKIIGRLFSFKYVNIETCNKIGISLRKQNKFRKAESAYKSALNYLPNSPVIYYNLAILHLYESNQARANECFTKALALDPGFSEARSMLDLLAGRQVPNNNRHQSPRTFHNGNGRCVNACRRSTCPIAHHARTREATLPS